MFSLILLLFTVCLPKRDKLSITFGNYVINRFKISIDLSAKLIKMIHISSLGDDFQMKKKIFVEETIFYFVLSLSILFSWLLHVGIRDLYIILILVFLLTSKPYFVMKKNYDKHLQIIHRQLPLLLSQMLLLMAAGMSTSIALEKVTRQQKDLLMSLLYKVTQEVKYGKSFERSMMALMAQCQHIYMTRFGRIILSHEKNGTQSSMVLLQELMDDLWKNRRALALKKGEEASTHLLMPMSIALIGIILLITIPAIYEIFTLT
jgi:tight adherence protein C